MNGPQFMMVRPSHGNVHEFVAEENTCFFDICLPNYTADSLRRITYFKEISEEEGVDSNHQTEITIEKIQANKQTMVSLITNRGETISQ